MKSGTPETLGTIAHPKKAAFLAAFAESGVISYAAEAASIDRGSHYHWLRNDPEYADAFEAAEQDATDALVAEARRRALDRERPSDTLLIFLLKSRRPDEYCDRMRARKNSDDMDDPTAFAARVNATVQAMLATVPAS